MKIEVVSTPGRPGPEGTPNRPQVSNLPYKFVTKTLHLFCTGSRLP
jgi:hypothetical protein